MIVQLGGNPQRSHKQAKKLKAAGKSVLIHRDSIQFVNVFDAMSRVFQLRLGANSPHRFRHHGEILQNARRIVVRF